MPDNMSKSSAFTSLEQSPPSIAWCNGTDGERESKSNIIRGSPIRIIVVPCCQNKLLAYIGPNEPRVFGP